MPITVDVAFVFLPHEISDRMVAGTLDCDVTAFDRRAQCRLVTRETVRSGERQTAKLVFPHRAPAWFRKGLTLRLWRGLSTFGAAIVQSESG